MLTQIQSGQGGEETAISLLTGCHDRIRHFTGIAMRIAQNPDAPPAELSDAAASVVRYYTVALPLHEQDENESVYPRLRDAGPPADVAAANDAMLHQHAGLNEVVAELLPLWQEVQRNPAAIASFAAPLRERTLRLEALWQEHLRLEEEIVFPAMQRELAAQLPAIAAEMRARRDR